MNRTEHRERMDPDHPPSDASKHEERDISVAGAFVFGVALLVVTGAAMVLMKWTLDMMAAAETRQQQSPVSLVRPAPQPGTPAGAAAEAWPMYPVRTLQEMRAAEDELLSSYAWIDREAGIARIPVQRAMDLLLEQGVLVREDHSAAGSADRRETVDMEEPIP